MKSRRRVSATLASLALVLTAVSVAAVGQASNAVAAGADANAYYLALGDSLAAGYQPDGTTSQGYADQFFRADASDVQVHATTLTNLACVGETLQSFWNGRCGAEAASQLQRAEDFHINVGADGYASVRRVNLVSISLGSTDLADALQPCLNPPGSAELVRWDCLAGSWPGIRDTFETNFTAFLRRLENFRVGAVSTPVRVVLFNLYNPFAALLSDPAQRAVSDAMVQQLNAFISDSVGQLHGVWVADAFGAINGYDGGRAEQDNLAKYTWMTGTNPEPHPTTAGYQQLCAALYDALPHS